jgi:hypothetical protein
MIIETKGWQFGFTIFGFTLIGVNGYALFNFNRFYLIMLHETSSGVIIFNKIASVIIMLGMIAIGGLILWVVKYSIIKCRKFRGEEKHNSMSIKDRIKQITIYAVILSLMAGGLLLLNRFASGTSHLLNTEKYEPPKQNEYISCTVDVISYQEKDKYTISPEWNNYTGVSTVKIITPQQYHGKIMRFKLHRQLPVDYPMKKTNAKCKLVISDKYLNNQNITVGSNNIISMSLLAKKLTTNL